MQNTSFEKHSFFDYFAILISFLLIAFIVISLLTILIGGFPFLRQALYSEEIHFSIMLSLTTSTISTILCLLFAIPCAYTLTRCSVPFAPLWRLLLELPLSLPYLVLGLCLLMVFSSEGGKLLKEIGIRIVFDPKGIIVAQWMVNIPFAIRMMRTAMEGVDIRLEFVAGLLGAGRWQRFTSITLPLCRSAIMMTFVLTWSRAIGEFGATLMLVGVTRMKTETLPASIYLNISTGDNGMAMASALILLCISSCTLMLSSWLEKKYGYRCSRL